MADLTNKQLQDSIAALMVRMGNAESSINATRATVTTLRAAVDRITPPPPALAIIKVRVGDDLQRALDSVTGPTMMRVQPGTYRGNFVLRRRDVNAPQWITIEPDVAVTTLNLGPSVPWITPAYTSALIKLESPNRGPALTCEEGTRRYWLRGLEGLPNPNGVDVDLFVLGNPYAATVAQLPSQIVLERCYLHGDPVKGQHRGLAFHVVDGYVLSSYFDDFFEPGRDSQAIMGSNGSGPYRIEDCFLGAASENILFGGDDARIPNLVPADVFIRGCRLTKNPAWRGRGVQVKNLLELKNARRVVIENCLLDNVWADAQAGDGVLFNTRNQDGANPWATVADVTMRYCVVRDVESAAFQLLGLDDHTLGGGVIAPSVHGVNVTMENNLLLRCGNGFKLNQTFRPTVIRHNTMPTARSWLMQLSGPPQPAGTVVYQSNVTASGEYGITGDSTGQGVPAFAKHAPSPLFDHNVIERATPFCQYPNPTANVLLDAGQLASLLDARQRYLGTAVGHDGLLVGADIDGLIARIPWAQW